MELRKEIQQILNNNTINENRVYRLEKLVKEYSLNQQSEMLEMLKRSVEEIAHLKHEYRDTGHCGKYLHECKQLITKATNI